MTCIAGDLTANNFAVVVIDIRHDKLHMTRDDLPCQHNPAYSPQYTRKQVADLRQAITKARGVDGILAGKVNGYVGAVGGSGGGAHAAWCAATESAPNAGDKLDAAVILSGAYKFDDQSSLTDPSNGPGYCANVTTYCKVMIPSGGCGALTGNADLVAASPIYQMNSNTAPLYAFATTGDSMPQGQFDAICNKIESLNGTNHCDTPPNIKYKAKEFVATVSGDVHSFAYWFDPADTLGNVNEIAKAFLCAHLAGGCSP
jgi:pimeloyl-ACP methyl ester carboxylesterase